MAGESFLQLTANNRKGSAENNAFNQLLTGDLPTLSKGGTGFSTLPDGVVVVNAGKLVKLVA